MDESRKQFQKWWEEWFGEAPLTPWDELWYGDGYYAEDIDHIWDAWKGSRAAIEIELPKPHAHLIWIQAGHAPDDYWEDVAVSYSEKDKCCDGSERYPVHAGWEIEEVLRAAGIKVKE